ncbi:dTMP kinase [Fodinibius salsisoli]|uniref:Thymidylate kinase n=1 Tax=Fodinibius salsisoli TaxID=2820877 RepID=A0ABT3PSL1_9BACT|nr:hypothetical protein [Fodinibius salsisoli]MCW9708847.1 hypothetical protein [Fodinibius salsisoli]
MLVVFEGPDNVGKTTISENVSKQLKKDNIPTQNVAFPGNQHGTLGRFIYELHHKHNYYNINHIPQISLRLLHVAAHFDTINTSILPVIDKKLVLLDRHWWSTFVYGKVGGIKREVLDKIMEIEKMAWKDIEPDIIFLINRKKPIEIRKNQKWMKLRAEYLKLAKRESVKKNIIKIENDNTIEETTQNIISILKAY